MGGTIDKPSVVGVAIGVVVEQQDGSGRVLITRRCRHSLFGGYWEFPGGKIESDETAEQCVVREIQEELGVTVRVDERLLEVEHQYEHGLIRLASFYCTLVSGKLRNLEVAEHRWVLSRELHNYQFLPANGTLLDRLVKDLG